MSVVAGNEPWVRGYASTPQENSKHSLLPKNWHPMNQKFFLLLAPFVLGIIFSAIAVAPIDASTLSSFGITLNGLVVGWVSLLGLAVGLCSIGLCEFKFWSIDRKPVSPIHSTASADACNEMIRRFGPILGSWARLIALRDPNTISHSRRSMELAVRLAKRMGLSGKALTCLQYGAMLHDIGKVGVPDSILFKPGPLTAEEWKIMSKHPEFAYEALAPIRELWPALEVPYCHHERWDGKGYPRGLRGEEIPLSARIFAVVDVWDSLCSDRPYRKAWSNEQALQYIQQERGAQFDPQVVNAFLEIVS